MDTISFVAITRLGDTCYHQFLALPYMPAPSGCKSWLQPVIDKDGNISDGITCCWLKIQFHEVTGEVNTSQPAINVMLGTVGSWLGSIGLTLDDFRLSRIDYDHNFHMPLVVSTVLMDTMQQLPERTMRMDKATFPMSVYYSCKSRHMQLYRKDKERVEKHHTVDLSEIGLVRQEVQCHASHVKYQQRYHGIARTWQNWITLKREAYYLTNAKPLFPKGDFYTLDSAISIIQKDKELTAINKKRLIDSLVLIQEKGIGALKAKHSTNTVKKYLNQLEKLNVNPLTIKNNIFGVDFIANPFYSVQPKGGATV